MPGRRTTDATGMTHLRSWLDDLHLRLLVRWERRRPPLPYSDRIDREIVVPRDRAGRPGYRFAAAGPSRPVRERSTRGATTDFVVRVGAASYVMGTCARPGDAAEGLLALSQESLDHVLSGSHGLRARQLAAPYATSLAGAPASAFQIEVESSPHRHVHTDTIVSYDGWLLTVGVFDAPADQPTSTALVEALLASWTWLPAGAR